MPVGPTIVAQASDSLRKIRNAARFILGNLNSGGAVLDEAGVDERDFGLVGYCVAVLVKT